MCVGAFQGIAKRAKCGHNKHNGTQKASIQRTANLFQWALDLEWSSYHPANQFSIQQQFHDQSSNQSPRHMAKTTNWSNGSGPKCSQSLALETNSSIEAARTHSWQVKKALGLMQTHMSLTQVNIPNPLQPNQCITINDKKSGKGLSGRGSQALHSSSHNDNTPITPHEGLGNLGTGSPAFLQTLNGTYDMQPIKDPYTVKLLTQLAWPIGIQENQL